MHFLASFALVIVIMNRGGFHPLKPYKTRRHVNKTRMGRCMKECIQTVRSCMGRHSMVGIKLMEGLERRAKYKGDEKMPRITGDVEVWQE